MISPLITVTKRKRKTESWVGNMIATESFHLGTSRLNVRVPPSIHRNTVGNTHQTPAV